MFYISVIVMTPGLYTFQNSTNCTLRVNFIVHYTSINLDFFKSLCGRCIGRGQKADVQEERPQSMSNYFGHIESEISHRCHSGDIKQTVAMSPKFLSSTQQ